MSGDYGGGDRTGRQHRVATPARRLMSGDTPTLFPLPLKMLVATPARRLPAGYQRDPKRRQRNPRRDSDGRNYRVTTGRLRCPVGAAFRNKRAVAFSSRKGTKRRGARPVVDSLRAAKTRLLISWAISAASSLNACGSSTCAMLANVTSGSRNCGVTTAARPGAPQSGQHGGLASLISLAAPALARVVSGRLRLSA